MGGVLTNQNKENENPTIGSQQFQNLPDTNMHFHPA
jgi:hypothetical protein